jgi:AbrB family looped-hinge helix DNA binding protein
MVKRIIDPTDLKFYGASTIGERGQIVIPAEARKDFDITPSTKLMFFGSPNGIGLMITKAESVAEVVARASEMLSGIQKVLKTGNYQKE